MKNRKLVAILTLLCFMFTLMPAAAMAADNQDTVILKIGSADVYKNSEKITTDVVPAIVDGRTLVPVRVIIEAMDGAVDWDEATRTVTITIDGKVLKLVIDQEIAGFGTGAKIIESRTMVPIRYISEYVGFTVKWVEATQQVIITRAADEAAETYTVSFDLNTGSEGVFKTVTVKAGQTVEKPDVEYKSGRVFHGWYTNDEGKGDVFDFITPIYSDVTLYGHWSTVSYGGGGSSAPSHTHKCEADGKGYHECKNCSYKDVCTPKVAEDGSLKCSVCDADYIVAAGKTFSIENKTIVNDGAGLESYGNVTLKDVVMNAGSSNDYALIFKDGTANLENVDVTSAGGGVGVVGGAKVTFDGDVAVNTASTSGRYNFYTEGAGSEITIEGGDFSFSKTLNQKRAYIYAGADTTVYVKGGTFGPASTRSGYTAGIMGEGTVIITGGTFGFDPSNWVADGYVAVKEGNNWKVIQCEHTSYTTAEGYHECDVCHVKEMCTPDETDGDAVTCSVCKNGYVVAAEGSFVAEGKKIVNDGVGLESLGTVTLKDVEVDAGSPNDYALIFKGGTANLENVDVTSAGGGVGVAGGAKATFNGGKVDVDSTCTSGRYNFYVVGDGTELTITGGDFSFSKTKNQKRAYIYAGTGVTVTVEGGTFGPASTRSGYTAGIMGDGTVSIKGGTFGFDPSRWVADGYQAVKDGSTWTVSAITVE